jgi:hypothetical protein
MVDITKDQEEFEQSNAGRKRREVSRYSYPYYDLDTALELVKILYNQAGGKASFAQLASYLGHKDESSGAFIAKIFGAKLFGIVHIATQNVSITPLGERLASLQPGSQRDLRLAEAFLNVPLFREVYKRFQNSTLPSTREGLLNVLQDNFGVPSVRAPVALKILLASAEQAGFKRADPNRLIHPVPTGLMEKEISLEAKTEKGEPAGGSIPSTRISQTGTTLSGIHPAISGFLQELPSEEQPWTENQRQRWLDAFTAMIKAIYPSEDEK